MYIYIYVYVYVYTYIHIYVYIYIYIHTRMHICMYMCIHVCAYAYTLYMYVRVYGTGDAHSCGSWHGGRMKLCSPNGKGGNR